MFKLRPFKNSDAACMPSWIIDEREFYFWSAGKFTYPLTADQIIAYAEVMADEQTAWPMTVLAENGSPAGHILLRRADYLQRSIHLGFVLLAPQYRGNGCTGFIASDKKVRTGDFGHAAFNFRSIHQ